MWGTVYFGQTYWAGIAFPPAPTTRPDCGGMWGATTWGGAYWGQELVCLPVGPTTRPDCGAGWGTATWGQPYWGWGDSCTTVPVPPVPPPIRHHAGARFDTQYEMARNRKFHRAVRSKAIRDAEARDQEDLELILAAWLNLK